MLSRFVKLTSVAILPFAVFAAACESDLDVGSAGGAIQPSPGCVDAACGDECNVCDADDANCVETAVLKQCDSDLQCVAEVAMCGGGSGDCEYGGKVYNVGDGFPSTDGCNSCSCEEEGVACTLMACADGCEYDGKHYGYGDSFDSTDGCNTCSCSEEGVACTEMACAGGCDYDGKHYEVDESFDSTDGCNTCGCTASGDVVCTEMACAYDACAGKMCGDTCTICDPNDSGCSETAVLKVCNEFGVCGAEMPACD
jgi:hypothetical protein